MISTRSSSAVDERARQVVGDGARVGVGGTVGEAGVGTLWSLAAEGQRRDAPAPRGEPDELLALGLQLGAEPQPGADDLGVERSRQTAVGGHQQDPDARLRFVGRHQREPRDLAAGVPRGLARHPPQRVRVGAQSGDPLLGTTQPGGGDGLHRARDLLDVLEARDAGAYFALGCHRSGSCVRPRPARPPCRARRPAPAHRRRSRPARGRAALPRRPAAAPPRRGRSRSPRRTPRPPPCTAACVSSDQSPEAIFSRSSLWRAWAAETRSARNAGTRSTVIRSTKPLVAA